MKIVFFGSPSSALPSLNRIIEDGHKIELIITQPDRPSGRGHALSFSPVKKRALEKELRDVNKSLDRITKDKYGICNHCGNPIEEERLKIRPTSSSCVSCKKKLKGEE